MPELHRGHKAGVDFPDYGGLVPPARVAPDKWLSGLPEDWQIVLVKHIFAFNEKGRGSDSEAILSLTQRGILERDISGNEGQLAESYENYPEVLEGDFVLNPMDLVAGWVARTNISGKVSGAYYSFHITNHERADGRFFEYLFQTYYRERIFDPFGSGLGRMESGGGRWTLGRDVLMNFPVPLPPINVQRVLASWLDQETSQIDLLISKKEQLIEKLLERRQALITHAVTKGLDPNLPMKDSGVSWLGEIPEGWKVAPMWSLARAQAGGTPESSTPEFWDDASGTPWIAIGDMSGVTEVKKTAKAVSELGIASKKLPMGRPGDVLFAMYASVGATSILGISATWNQAILGLRVQDEVAYFKFLSYLLVGVSDVWNLLSNSNTQANLNQHSVMHLRVPLPPMGEQVKIASHLDQETAQIDTLVEKTRRASDLLKERRQALITQVVTGKLDVRGFASGNS